MLGISTKANFPGRLPVPKEHGAWALVYGPLTVTSLAFGSLDLRLPLLVAAATAFFMSHEPLSRMARASTGAASPERMAQWRFWAAVYVALGALAGLCLISFWPLGLLPWMAFGVAALFAVHLRLVARRAERRVAGEVLGVVGLTATAPITYYVFQARLDWVAGIWWALNILYFCSGIFFVKMTVSRHVGKPGTRRRVRDCVLYHAPLLPLAAGAGWSIGAVVAAPLAMLPIVVRAFAGVWRPPAKLSLKSIGYREVFYTVLFVVVLGLGFRFDL